MSHQPFFSVHMQFITYLPLDDISSQVLFITIKYPSFTLSNQQPGLFPDTLNVILGKGRWRRQITLYKHIETKRIIHSLHKCNSTDRALLQKQTFSHQIIQVNFSQLYFQTAFESLSAILTGERKDKKRRQVLVQAHCINSHIPKSDYQLGNTLSWG